ncbi:UDP-N-acetylmuramoyl-L-alanine--D-glutamate ligase [Sinimarinibacterium sp. CAU 1509]|uniref:UDP-N-acetylmuramoyl-L-alanine--D-glutamate ligase n=1 Tax=Sinimarinibacterium sp. CAU 1509 TaxID=2562283 RepID=UPI0010ACE6CF|nr:UDP-N-acetylmuramoyl-L-alanine--D-glutamate ligase [Sinimarinibacterium sp. CAU 1509]TJY65159.1 UDP-N-acetylmuramoyl-L-alanine--D-glutamate ligase [Sinimarinibacterium sp. CAU 1509]
MPSLDSANVDCRRYDGQRVLVVGLGVSGTSALRYLAACGAQLVVTDSRAAPAGIDVLRTQFPEVEFHLGSFSAPQPLTQFKLAVLSPGVSLDEPFVAALRDAGVEIVGDIELFARAAGAPVIGITGSNGKSTVTTLVGEMARAAGLRTAVGGNLGTPALDLLADDVELYVLELSSFQLETTQHLHCVAATVLNLSQDHLDRHHTMAHYAAVKARIFEHCDTAVVNRDDPQVMAMLAPSAGHRVLSFGTDMPLLPRQYGLLQHGGDYTLTDAERSFTLDDSELGIFGLHNLSNALAALALTEAAGIERAACLQALRQFRGLPHRCEFVRELDGVRYFNDSKGTNVGSTLAALNGLPALIVWLGGGQGKGQSFAPLREALAGKGRAAIVFGEDAERIESDVFGALPIYREPDMSAALARARTLAQPRDQVLLSPACASFDQFRSYVDRGDQFRAMVGALA